MWWLGSLAIAQTVVLDGAVSADGGSFALVPFEVPAGTMELQVDHASLSNSVLDWGLLGPDGVSRGWGGGNSESVWLQDDAASRSYLPGLPPGEWKVVIGKARLVGDDSPYSLTVRLFDAEQTAPDEPRTPYVESPPLEVGTRWYAGDFHVHSRQSGDARASLDEIAALARERGLDFVVITDHNTTSSLDYLTSAQQRHPDVLFVPGMEYTTYNGHLNAIGSVVPLDHLLGVNGATVDAAIRAVRDAGGLVSINHPALDVGPACIGCAWEHPVEPGDVDAVEIQTGGLLPVGGFFTDPSIDVWTSLTTVRDLPAALGGSDDHRAGIDLGFQESPIGSPTTMVLADELSVPALVAAVRSGRTVVKLQEPADPMVELTVDGEVTARVTGTASGVRFVVDGVPEAVVAVDTDPFVAQMSLEPLGQVVRAEAFVDGERRTITSHQVNQTSLPPVDSRCGCRSGPAGWGWPLARRRQ